MKANKFSSETLKNAITIKMIKIIPAVIIQSHFASALLKAENVPSAKTIQMAKITNCMKLMENHIIEKATQEKNHFFIC